MSWISSAFGTKISPVILFIIVVLAVIFFISAVVHLLIRFLVKQRSTNPNNYPEIAVSGTLQRQLQHLFNIHDSGLDQATIDALPVFLYMDIMGLKEPFDCAVCLCEFSKQDKLRLLPICSHAFHIDCIDTWLLSNSTCPLCRGVILSFENPVFYFDESKDVEDGSSRFADIDLKGSSDICGSKRVFSVRLGKFKNTSLSSNLESEVGETSNSNMDARRCFSMGSCQYIVADSELQVSLCPRDGENVKGREEDGDIDGKKINGGSKGESFSVSKIWQQWSKKGKFPSSRFTYYSNSVNESLP